MKKNILFIFGLMAALPGQAQDKSSALIECIYESRYITDTTAAAMSPDGTLRSGNDAYIADDSMVLHCGGTISFFYNIKADTAYNSQIAGRLSDFKVYKDFEDNTVSMVDKVGLEWLRATEKIPDFKWQIQDEWKEIAGYKVRKATCDFRGRSYVAWYAPDVPVPDGPWKFCGLPGLILEVYDVPCQYYYCLTGIQEKKTEVEYMDVHFIDTGLKKFYRNRRMYLEDPISYLSATYGGPINYSGDPEELKNKLGYDFQEIDF